MKKLSTMPETQFLKIFFTFFSLSFLIAAFFMPDRADMIPGLWRIFSSPAKAPTNYFDVGGYAATFLNMGLVGLICTGLYCLPGRKANNAATLVTLLTVGFGSWGIHPVNMLPGMLGVILHCIVKREHIGKNTNAMLFSTGLAPFISELMVRYPHAQPIGFHVDGVFLALLVGMAVGYFLPTGLENSPKIHKGFALYSAALPVGMTAFLLQGILYKSMGLEIPAAVSDLSVSSAAISNTFCIVFFTLCILGAMLMGCTLPEYAKTLISPQHIVHFGAAYGNAAMLMNVGCSGLFILAYFNFVGAEFNGIVFGSVFCMLSTCNSGSHPLNILPIMMGYGIACRFFQFLSPYTGGEFTQFLHSQSIIVGICYANGLSPISNEYGFQYGFLAAFMHFCMVTTVPQLHGGMCLYNGGFTAALVCLLLVPGLERHARNKQVRRESLVEKFLDSLPWHAHHRHL